jgi:hypothetical protein
MRSARARATRNSIDAVWAATSATAAPVSAHVPPAQEPAASGTTSRNVLLNLMPEQSAFTKTNYCFLFFLFLKNSISPCEKNFINRIVVSRKRLSQAVTLQVELVNSKCICTMYV